MVNQAVTCVALFPFTCLAKISTLVFVLFVSLALILTDWKFVPIIVIWTSFPYVNVGLMLVIPCESVVVVVLVGLGEPLIEKILAYFTN